MTSNDLKRVIEALIFAADAPLTPERIRETLEACTDEDVAQTVETLNGEYEAAEHSFMIRSVAGGYQVTTRPQYSNWIKKLYLGRQKGRLSQAGLESLAIIAFKQPISRVDIAQIRGVNSDAVIGTLLERKLVTISGRSEAVGRPLLYSTTAEFLEFFGINDLAELPKPREIEELIGKEGMPEEVLQALSSDKQLKLPISFEPETTLISGNAPRLLSATIPYAEVVEPEANTTEVQAVNVATTEAEELPAAVSEAEALSVDEKAPAVSESATQQAGEIEANAEVDATVVDSAVEPMTLVSQAEVQHFLPQTELSDKAAVSVAVVEPPEASAKEEAPASTKKKKDRKRGKRDTQPEENVADQTATALAENENQTFIEDASLDDLATPPSNAPTVVEISNQTEALVEDVTEASSTDEQIASANTTPDLTAFAQEEKFDFLVLAEEAFEIAPQELTAFDKNESDLACELSPLQEEKRLLEMVAPRLVNEITDTTDPLTTVEEPHELELVEEEPQESLTVISASEVAKYADFSEPVQLEALNASAVSLAARSAEEKHGNEQQSVIAVAPLMDDEPLEEFDQSERHSVTEIDSWPEINEVRFEEPIRVVEVRREEESEFVAAEMPATPSVATPSHGEELRMIAAEQALARNTETRVAEALRNEEPDFFV